MHIYGPTQQTGQKQRLRTEAGLYLQVGGKWGHHSHPWGPSPWAWVPKNLWIDNGYFLN